VQTERERERERERDRERERERAERERAERERDREQREREREREKLNLFPNYFSELFVSVLTFFEYIRIYINSHTHTHTHTHKLGAPTSIMRSMRALNAFISSSCLATTSLPAQHTKGLGFRVKGLGFRVKDLGHSRGLGVDDLRVHRENVYICYTHIHTWPDAE
jgi:hypothetical protein